MSERVNIEQRAASEYKRKLDAVRDTDEYKAAISAVVRERKSDVAYFALMEEHRRDREAMDKAIKVLIAKHGLDEKRTEAHFLFRGAGLYEPIPELAGLRNSKGGDRENH